MTTPTYAVVPEQGTFSMRDFVTEPRPITLPEQGRKELVAADLDDQVLGVLDHVRRVEEDALGRMRDILITPTSLDAVVTAFLTTWAYEKFWLGDTLRRVLDEYPPLPPSRPGLRDRIGVQLHERVWPVVSGVATHLMGSHVTAGHLARELADTLALRVTMVRLAAQRPVLQELAEAVLHSTERHIAFFLDQIRTRARADVWARRRVGLVLRTWRWPGTRHADAHRAATMLHFLLGHPQSRGVVAQADSLLASLPGAARLAVLRTEFARFVVHGTTGRKLRVQ